MKFKNTFFVFFLCSIAFISCNKANFSIGTQAPTQSKTVNQEPSSPTPPSTGPAAAAQPSVVEAVITKLSPSFVTRGAGCIMCHADIKGGFFLDFGYDPSENNKFFLGGANDILPPQNGVPPASIFYGGEGKKTSILLGESPYFAWYAFTGEPGWMGFTNTTAKSQVQGTLYIPDVTFTKEQYPGLFATYINPANPTNPAIANLSSITLLDLLNTSLQIPPSVNGDPNTDPQGSNPMAAVVKPLNKGDPPVVVLKELKIGAPTSADIKNLIKDQACQAAGCLVVKGDHTTVGGFRGINPINRPTAPQILNGCIASEIPASNAYSNMVNTQGVMSVSQIFCSGDVVIVGSLFLKNVTIKTDASGCRFYVDGNVWIDGETISYVDDTNGKSHLQITSTGGISFGLYNAPSGNPANPEGAPGGSILRRLLRDAKALGWAKMVRRTTPSTNRDSNYAALQQFMNYVLCDGTYAPDNFFTTVQNNAGIKSIKKVILNAPLINGYFRNTSNQTLDPRIMTGIIISEQSLFGGNNFSFKFEYDPVFSNNDSFSFFPAFSSDVRNRIFYAVEK